VGDRVEFDFKDDDLQGILKEVITRKNYLYRPPVANVDKVFIVSAFSKPAPNTLIIDTVISICEHNNIKPIIIFNKSDLGDFDEYVEIYEKAGYKVIVTSATNGDGIKEIEKELDSGISVFTGNSGVGKSSILNVLIPELQLKTGEISEKLGRGKHTTRHAQLYESGFGGYVADTPGFATVEVDKTDYSFKENLENLFIEFNNYLGECRFTGCSHTGESGCAVCEAVKNGEISISRHESYKMLYNELKDIKKWQTKK
ncbi:MAG: ribosome small subunit-dependent GTPase A, partial [Clostridia bacterium]|nr:ribosome small subunit-dependent GTPase A [Clostridia bacterium]